MSKKDMSKDIDNVLTVGDSVWHNGRGSDGKTKAKVLQIEITNGAKYGKEVDSVHWSLVYGRNVVVSLDNDCWAYASQIKQM